jgi:hypothetical protein
MLARWVETAGKQRGRASAGRAGQKTIRGDAQPIESSTLEVRSGLLCTTVLAACRSRAVFA